METRFIPRTAAPPSKSPHRGDYYQTLVQSAMARPAEVLEIDPRVRAPMNVYKQIRRAASQLGVGKNVESWCHAGKVYVAVRQPTPTGAT